jgi:carbonic anhydrase/acetyltransferase-like protein (isoleucine patch superfamily)
MPVYEIDGRTPTIDPTAWVAPSADVIGDVTLAAGATVWFGAVLRADVAPVKIGARSNIQDGTVCHADPGYPLTVGEGCTIGHQVMLHGCTIEDGALVGMGSTILNGAVIGAGSLVGANALVTEGKVFPPNSLIIGSPAKAVRELDEAARAGLLQSAKHYADKGAAYAIGLTLIDAG